MSGTGCSTAGAEAQLQQVQESVAAMRARCVAVGSPQDAAEDAVAAAEAAVEQCNKLHAALQANAGAHSSQASGEAVAFREAVADANNKAKVCTSVVLHKGGVVLVLIPLTHLCSSGAFRLPLRPCASVRMT